MKLKRIAQPITCCEVVYDFACAHKLRDMAAQYLRQETRFHCVLCLAPAKGMVKLIFYFVSLLLVILSSLFLSLFVFSNLLSLSFLINLVIISFPTKAEPPQNSISPAINKTAIIIVLFDALNLINGTINIPNHNTYDITIETIPTIYDFFIIPHLLCFL